MFKAFLYLLMVAAAALGLAWFAERPGSLTLQWLGYEVETSVFVAVVAIFAVVTLLLLVFGLIAWLVTSPRRMARYVRERRRMRGYEALRRGMFAIGAGDETAAARHAIEARRNLPNEPMTKLLRAQSAQLSGDRGTARRIFETLADEGDTQLLGLRGLFLEANYEGHTIAAKQFAERAVSLNPALPWAVHALFDMQCKDRDWQGALETLAVARTHRHFGRKALDRRRAVLLTAQAQDLEQSDAARAVDLALEAHRLAPNFVPAAVIGGRILAGQGNMSRAARVLARTWQYAPHPEIAVSYAFARPGDSPHDRLNRIRSLIVMTPDDPEARIALATAAVDARDWAEARDALQPLLDKNPTARICALMARIEGGEKRDAGRVREWLARAVRAPRDPVWIADGVVSNEWRPISPVTGALDAFEWRVPPDRPSGSAGDPLFDEISALSHELETVARQINKAKAPEDETKPVVSDPEAGGPITITIKAEESSVSPLPVKPQPPKPVEEPAKPAAPAPTAAEAEVVAVSPAPAPKPDAAAPEAMAKQESRSSARGDAGEAATGAVEITEPPRDPASAQRPGKKAQAEIFIPARPPDDPGPEPNDFDETTTPISRYRSH
jgi:HemY protein